MKNKVSWANLKSFVDSRNLYVQYYSDGINYFIAARDSWFEVQTVISVNDAEDAADRADFETNYMPLANKQIEEKTSLKIPKVAMYEPEGFFKSYVSHNLCDRTTWYQESTEVLGETLVQSSGTTFTFANSNIIDAEHGKITGEKDYSLSFSTFTYSQTLRSKYGVKIYDNGVLQFGGYTIDYAAGSVTFDSMPTGPVTADYYYESGSGYTVEATSADKILQIRHVEIQFTDDIGFNSAIVQSIKAYNPMSPPNRIEVEHIEFLTEYDVINIGNEGKGQIIKYGSIPHNINVFPFAYGRTIDLASSLGSQITVTLENDIPMTGTFSTITFYTTEEDA